MQKRHHTRKSRHPSGPGRLTWAWLALVLMVGAVALMIQMTGDPEAGDQIVLLEVSETPETMAPATDLSMAATVSPPLNRDRVVTPAPAATPEAPTGSKVITLPAANPEPLPQPATPPPAATEDAGKAERLQIMQDATAKVIRLDDLPSGDTAAGNGKPASGTAPPLPDSALFTTTRHGPYPQIANDGRRAATYYRRGFKDPQDRPRISIIVGGLGLSSSLTDQAIRDLPPEVTLAFAPYGKNLDVWANQARAAGHELMVELPMDSTGMDPAQLGPAGLLASRSPLENEQRLDWLLSRFAGYFGVTNYLGNKLSTDNVAFRPVLDQIRVSGAAFIGDDEISGSASLNGPPSARTDVVIGADTGPVLGQLENLEKLAKSRRQVLVKIYPTGQSLSDIANWAGTLPDKGIVLAPASAAIDRG